MSSNNTWWKEAIVYQIYPRSFKDSNGDGIGDLSGIISKLDYIKSLGVDVVWLNPIYESPNDDNGYDISDYQKVMPEFGTMDDFDELLKGLHDRGIKLVMDLVVNHCSDEHRWFQESRKSRDNPYRDYFHWWLAENGKPPERWSWFDTEGAWTYDETTDAYYLHYFSKKQPDLNWENPKVRTEIYDLMHFWLKKGIDGFRMDVITLLSKDMNFPARPDHLKDKHWEYFYSFGPRLYEYLEEMNREVISKYDAITVGEGPGLTSEEALELVEDGKNGLNMVYHFDHMNIGVLARKMLAENYQDLVAFKKVHSKWDDVFKEKGWGTVYLGNHDQPRMVTRWADDSPEWRSLSAKMLNTWLLTMRGTPYLYHGDEIGMTNIKFDNIDDYNDIETKSNYELIKAEGGNLEAFLSANKITARDNGRTPVQWDKSANGGFTKGKPWLKVNDNYQAINVAQQETDSNSVLNYFRKLVALRKEKETFTYGDYEVIDIEHSQIYAYTRSLKSDRFLIVLNFSKAPVEFKIPEGLTIDKLLLNNYNHCEILGAIIPVQPFQALIFQLK